MALSSSRDFMSAPQRDTEAVRRRWQHDLLVTHLALLPAEPTEAEYLDAFDVRDNLAQLFLGSWLYFYNRVVHRPGQTHPFPLAEVQSLCR